MKFSHVLTLILSIAIFCKCGKKGEDYTATPTGILSQEEFSAVLVDFALSESIQNLNVHNVPFQTFDSVYAFNPLIEHHLRKTQYDSTILFYAAHPQQYKQVYDTVLARLGELKLSREKIFSEPASK